MTTTDLTISTARSESKTVADREFWTIVAFCTVGFAATIFLFEHFPFLSSQML